MELLAVIVLIAFGAGIPTAIVYLNRWIDRANGDLEYETAKAAYDKLKQQLDTADTEPKPSPEAQIEVVEAWGWVPYKIPDRWTTVTAYLPPWKVNGEK